MTSTFVAFFAADCCRRLQLSYSEIQYKKLSKQRLFNVTHTLDQTKVHGNTNMTIETYDVKVRFTMRLFGQDVLDSTLAAS